MSRGSSGIVVGRLVSRKVTGATGCPRTDAQRSRAVTRRKNRVKITYSDDSDHPFRGKATTWLREQRWVLLRLEVVGLRRVQG